MQIRYSEIEKNENTDEDQNENEISVYQDALFLADLRSESMRKHWHSNSWNKLGYVGYKSIESNDPFD